MFINFAWKLFDKFYSDFILSNQDDVSNYLDRHFYNVDKIKNIDDSVCIRTDLMTEEDDLYKEKSIKGAYNIIAEKFNTNIPLNNFENNLYRFVIDKFERYKLLKTVFISVYFTILFTIISIVISVLVSFFLRNK